MVGNLIRTRMLIFLVPVLLVSTSLFAPSPYRSSHDALQSQELNGSLTVLDRSGEVVDEVVDGNLVQVQLELDQETSQIMDIQFLLGSTEVASCSIPVGAAACTSKPFFSLGWYWDANGAAQPLIELKAISSGAEVANTPVQVRARPVVMVHGFASNWTAWETYLGPQGYLSKAGIPGFAVGDDQVEGFLNTGNLDDPAGRTNTIQENAEIVGQYIANVKEATGAEMVDLLAHSMGGLISRYYIGQVMQERDVAQLMMLGSPMSGTDCANLPASLGLYLPAALEIRPSYVESIFNQQVTRRHGLAFYALAGDPITEAFQSPCTSVPTDIAVSQSSVTAIPLEAHVMPVLHMTLNTSEEVFQGFVLPLLQKSAGQYPEQPDALPELSEDVPLEFTRIFTGHLDPGQSQELVIQIEEGVSVAGFSMFDTSRSLENRVRGASGNEIELSVDNHGLVVLDDPSALFYLGYGFRDPKPGQWRVTLLTTADTPPAGADYALTAYMIGGARLETSVLPILPQPNDQVRIEARISLNDQPVDIQAARALIQKPDGELLELDLSIEGSQASGDWQPDIEGLYGIDLRVTGTLEDGIEIERTGFLSIQAQPEKPPTRIVLIILAVAGLGLFLIVGLLAILFILRLRRHR